MEVPYDPIPYYMNCMEFFFFFVLRETVRISYPLLCLIKPGSLDLEEEDRIETLVLESF